MKISNYNYCFVNMVFIFFGNNILVLCILFIEIKIVFNCFDLVFVYYFFLNFFYDICWFLLF